MKVLVSAYACEPNKGSEPGIGWNWVQQIARFHQVWVITRENNRESIERAVVARASSNVCFLYFDLPYWMRFWKRRERGIYIYYLLWQIGAYLLARRLHRKVRFDLVHHVTFVNYWLPSFMCFLPVPFVWGPVGGGECAPRSFFWRASWRGKMYEVLRDFARGWAYLNPLVYIMSRRAKAILATTDETTKRLPRVGRHKVTIFSPVGISKLEIDALEGCPVRDEQPFRLMSVGRLVHWKGFDLGIKAFAQLKDGLSPSEYWIVGDGPERRRLERLVSRLGLASRVVFCGTVGFEEFLKHMRQSDVVVHPSLHDSGGGVVAEAMAAGRPVVCLDLGGPALLIADGCGIKIPAVCPEQVVRELAQAIGGLLGDLELRAQLGMAAHRRIEEHFVWDKRGELMEEIYTRIVPPDMTPSS